MKALHNSLKIMLFLTLGNLVWAQSNYKVHNLGTLEVSAVVDPMAIENDFFPLFNYKEAPNPVGSHIMEIKQQINQLFPRKEGDQIEKRSIPEPPIIEAGFDANPRQANTPTDNTMAIGYDGTNITAVNSNLQFRAEDGSLIRNFSLNSFSVSIANGVGKFDPRAIFDPESNRYAMVWLAGSNSESSTIIVAFSSSDDVREPWNLYSIDGSPQGPGLWSDYPMISFTDSELILTINLILEGEPWQTGFSETLIYQMDKEKAYAGESFELNMIDGIQFGGTNIRYLHPVKSADSTLEDELYLLSNVNFAIENDSMIMVKLTGGMDNPELEFSQLRSDINYNVSPDSPQIDGTMLYTNDARILDAFLIGDHIQFVGNSLAPNRNSSGVYHGTIPDVNNPGIVNGQILDHPDLDLGYPGIAWTGIEDNEYDAIVVAQHSSTETFAGISALYLDQDGEASEWISVREGEGFLDMLNGATERWGDYIGCQRKFNEPGIVWVSSMYPDDNNRSNSWLAALSESERQQSSTSNPLAENVNLEVFPNPAFEIVTINIDLPRNDFLYLSLDNNQGQTVHVFHNDRTRKKGLLEFSFDISSLSSGVYIFRGILGTDEIVTRKIVKE